MISTSVGASRGDLPNLDESELSILLSDVICSLTRGCAGKYDLLTYFAGLGFDLSSYLSGFRLSHDTVEEIEKQVVIKIIEENKNIDVNATDSMGSTALHKAAQIGKCHIVDILCKLGSSLELRNVLHNVPLHHAAKNGFSRCCSVLLDNGADIDATTRQGYTAAHMAAINKKTNALVLLIRRGCRVEFEDSAHSIAIWAVSHGCGEALYALLERGVSVEQGILGGNLLFSARAETENIECLKLLIAFGIDPLKRNNIGMSAVDYAIDKKFSVDWIETLKTYAAKEYPPSLKITAKRKLSTLDFDCESCSIPEELKQYLVTG